MSRADLADGVLGLAQHAQDGFGQHADGGGRGLLHKDVAIAPVLEGVEHQLDRVVQRHHEPRHGRVGDGDGVAGTHLVHKERITEPREAITLP